MLVWFVAMFVALDAIFAALDAIFAVFVAILEPCWTSSAVLLAILLVFVAIALVLDAMLF